MRQIAFFSIFITILGCLYLNCLNEKQFLKTEITDFPVWQIKTPTKWIIEKETNDFAITTFTYKLPRTKRLETFDSVIILKYSDNLSFFTSTFLNLLNNSSSVESKTALKEFFQRIQIPELKYKLYEKELNTINGNKITKFVQEGICLTPITIHNKIVPYHQFCLFHNNYFITIHFFCTSEKRNYEEVFKPILQSFILKD